MKPQLARHRDARIHDIAVTVTYRSHNGSPLTWQGWATGDDIGAAYEVARAHVAKFKACARVDGGSVCYRGRWA